VLISKLPGARLFNVVFPEAHDERAFQELLNWINHALQAWESHGMLICDQGKDATYTKLARRMYRMTDILVREAGGQGSEGITRL